MGKINKKKIDTANSVKNSPPDMPKPEPIEKAPESATQCDLRKVEDTSESRILDHEDFVRMAKRFAS